MSLGRDSIKFDRRWFYGWRKVTFVTGPVRCQSDRLTQLDCGNAASMGDVTVQFLCCTGCCFPKRAINYKNPRRFPSESCRVGSPPELLMKGALARQFRDFFKLIHMSHGDKWPASGCLAGDFVWDKNAPGDASPRDITSRSYYHSILNGKNKL
jgi:hypothetical protein